MVAGQNKQQYMKFPDISEITPSATGYPIKNYAFTFGPREMSAPEYHTRHIDKDFLREIVETESDFCTK